MEGEIAQVLHPENTMLRPLWHIEDRNQNQPTDMSNKLFKSLMQNPDFADMQESYMEKTNEEDDEPDCPCGDRSCIVGNISMGSWLHSTTPKFKEGAMSYLKKHTGLYMGKR